ncbi:TcdA/TcdB pore-forming domain-containing protein [Pseudomonas koreensis]|uniref:TcdA/TcdB pore-forming domain-containing protein n=1 Tax=Pseudomonas koreensis TaxID=198620 RepID=UPI003F8543E0
MALSDFEVSVLSSGFSNAFDRDELKSMASTRNGGSYEAQSLSYYDAAVSAKSFNEQLTAVRLLRESFESDFADASNAQWKDYRQQLVDYHQRLSSTVEVMAPGKPVPRIMHFVWVGGSEVGPNQRDYMNIWRKVLAPQGYTFNLWYDSDALLAFEMNRVILDSARAHAMESGGAQEQNYLNLSRMIEDRARVLKQQMFDHLSRQEWSGRADLARIDLMVRAYGKDRATLEAFRQKCLDSHQAMVGADLHLRDVRTEFADHYLNDVYQREIAMRGNFAAASDVVRLQAVHLEGGRYSDMDYLPPLLDKLGGVDVSGLESNAKPGVLQLLLNENDALLPGRDRQRYADRTGDVPVEHLEALRAFAAGHPDVLDIFRPPYDGAAPQDAIRLGTVFGLQTTGEMNAHFLAHPDSGMTESIMQVIRSNYDGLHEVERRMRETGLDWSNREQLRATVSGVVANMVVDGRLPGEKKASLEDALSDYYSDGIRPGARGTIALTGPSAASRALVHYSKTHLQPGLSETIRARLKLVEGYNVFTEEEMISGWTVGGTSAEWLAKEKEKWTSGKLKTRYTGNLSDLLKDQTLTFKRGWPVVEGKPVMLTSVLQQLLDDLGEPFRRAMNDRLSGEITFRKAFYLTFDQRQQILAQPVAELPESVGAEALGNLNEAFTRVASGRLPLAQLSPLHRVVFGGLFGAQHLDDEGFAEAWATTRTFVSNTEDRGIAARYDQIEQTLRERSPSAFEAGLKAPLPGAERARNAYLLKAQALVEPLSVRQWGEHVARVESLAKKEYRASILQRGGPVRARLFQVGAVSAKQLPQDLLMQGDGDPGRRCYPLALLMAAAVEKGRTAQRTLIGRLATTNLAPQDAESHALLRVLDEMRGVPMAQFGEKLGAADLATVIRTLEANTSTSSIMFNTQNHSLLACKVVEANSASYLFYDPNFAVYEFTQAEHLQRGIEAALADEKLAGLYGIQNPSTERFELIALDGSNIANKALPSEVTAGDLLRSGPVAGERTVAPWQHHAALRTRALSENARLGRGLAELEGTRMAQTIESANRQLFANHTLDPRSVVLYETVKNAGPGKWTLSLINSKEPSKVTNLTVDDPRFLEIKLWLSDRFEALKQIPSPASPEGPKAVHTLNAGFAIMAALEKLNKRGDAKTSNATLAVRLHSFVIYGQLLHGVVSDVVALVKLVELALLDERLIAQASASALAPSLGARVLGEGLGTLLALANVGFDIIELATADNTTARTAAAVQLSFDATALALSGGAITVGGTFAAVAGPLAVIVGGLGFGIGALARNYSLILERAQQVGQYVYALKAAYSNGGCQVVQGTLEPLPDALITRIDLRTRYVKMGSQLLLSAERQGWPLPRLLGEDTQPPINIRERWNLPELSSVPWDIHTLILPCTPACTFGIDYQLMPGVTHRHDKGFDEFRELEKDSQGRQTFWFDASTPLEYCVYKLFPNYHGTLVKVVLDEQCRSLQVPQVPVEWHGKMSYDIEAVTGQYSLSLVKGVANVQLSTAEDPAALRWVIAATWVDDVQAHVDGLRLRLGTTEVHCVAGSEVCVELAQGQIYRVDWPEQRLTLLEDNLPEQNDAVAIARHLTGLNHTHRLASPWLPLHNFKVPLADPQWPVHTNAWFESATDRILYGRDLPARLNAEIRLAAVFGDQVFLYHSDQPTLWRVDALTGRVNRRYRLIDPFKPSQVLSCQDVGDAIRVIQQVTDLQEVVYQFEYLVDQEKVELVAVSSTLKEGLPFDSKHFQWQGWNSFINGFNAYEKDGDGSVSMVEDIRSATAATFLSLQVHHGAGTFNAWIRRRDDWFVTDNDLGLEHPLLIASPIDADGRGMVFHDSAQKGLYTWQRNADASGGSLQLMLSDVDSVVATADGHLAQTTQGLVFDLRNGNLKLRALSEQWLRAQGDWIKTLTSVAEQQRADGFDILGLSDHAGAPLSARYLQGKILLVGAGQGRNLHLVTQTPDKTGAWLFASGTGHVFRQVLQTPEQIRALFGNATRLSRHDALAAAQRVWAEWTYAAVSPLESGLEGRTRDGVILELSEGQPARISAVTHEFVMAPSNGRTLQQRLESLIEGRPHVPYLRAGSQENRFSWYDAIARRLHCAEARSDGQWVTYLGALQDSRFLMYDGIEPTLFSNDREIFTRQISARRNGAVLAVDSADHRTRLQDLLVEGVETLVLGYDHRGMSCTVASADWSRLDCLIVDLPNLEDAVHVNGSELLLEMPELDRWQVVMAGEHLVLTDPDSGRSLILRNARSLGNSSGHLLDLQLHLWGDYRFFKVLEVINGWQMASIDGAPCDLAVAMDTSNEV